MFKILKDAAKPAKDLASAAGLAVAIGYFNDAQCGVTSHYFANAAMTEAVTVQGCGFRVFMMLGTRNTTAV